MGMTAKPQIIRSTLNELTKPENRLKAIRMYAMGVMEDFPETKVWMVNILRLAGAPEGMQFPDVP